MKQTMKRIPLIILLVEIVLFGSLTNKVNAACRGGTYATCPDGFPEKCGGNGSLLCCTNIDECAERGRPVQTQTDESDETAVDDLGGEENNDSNTGGSIELGRIGEGKGLGPFSAEKAGTPGEDFEKVISTTIGIMTIAGMLWFMAQLIIGALGWVSAGGDPKRLEAARGRITNAIIGLTIVVAAWAVIGVVGTILGLEILNPADIIDKLPTGIPTQ